jgi:thiol-disulfide isomerase/thioredoxin
VFIPIYIGYRFEITSKWLVKSFFLVLLVLLFRVSLSRAYPIFLQVENYDNISGIYSKEIQFKSIEFRDENGDVLFLNEDNVLLDFWTNTCGVCIKKFPKVVDVVEGLDNQPFYLVNVIDDESQMIEAKEILKQRDVSLKNIFLFKENIEKFDINYYPTVIKVENNEIVFKGMIESYVYFDFIRNL